MTLIVIYGPPASGKLTVAHKLAEKLGYNIIDNHKILDILAPLFPFDDTVKSRSRRNLFKKISELIFNEVARNSISCITTFGNASKSTFNSFREIQRLVNRQGGEVLFVQLMPTENVLLERVESHTRKSKINSRINLQIWLKNNPHAFDSFPDVEHLLLDNSALSASKAALKIIQYYSL